MRTRPGQETHGAYSIERRIRRDEVDGRTRLGKRVRALRLGFAVALGYPAFESAPAPVREAVKNAVRLALVCERLFSGFWTGEEVPKFFYTASENLRRQVGDLGLEPRAPTLDVAAALAAMREDRPGAAPARRRPRRTRRARAEGALGRP